MKTILRLALLMNMMFGLLFAFQEKNPTDIEEFGGLKNEIIGLFGEPVPQDFFSKNLLDAYSSKMHYRGTFSLSPKAKQKENDVITAYNPNNFNAEISVSCVMLENGISKNFLIKLNPYEYKQIEISKLRKFNQIYALSFTNFEIYFDSQSVDRFNKALDIVHIESPQNEFTKNQASEKNITFYSGSVPIQVVDQSNGASANALAIYILASYPPNTQSLKIQSPAGYDYHLPTGYRYRTPGYPQDIFDTRAPSTKRFHHWYDMNALACRQASSASAECISYWAVECNDTVYDVYRLD